MASPYKTRHQQRVEQFMVGAGQDLPDRPTIPSRKVCELRARLILEEALETIAALGFSVLGVGPATLRVIPCPDINEGISILEVVDGCCDLSVVTSGTLSAFGIADVGPLGIVDRDNLKKIKNGSKDEHGKFIKPPGHLGPGELLAKEINRQIERAENRTKLLTGVNK